MNRKRRGLIGVVIATLLLTTGCLGNNADNTGSENSPITDDASATLTIWTDATRLPVFQAYQKQNPDQKLNIVTLEAGVTLSKVQLANRAKKGWPDIIWTTEGQVATLLGDNYQNFVQPIGDLIPKNVQDGFGSSLDACRIDGKLYCLKNDIAQNVLYYNAAKMDEYGYKVPTTMKEYQELAIRAATEHPGTISDDGFITNSINDFYWPSGCPFAKTDGPNAVTINYSDPSCTRVTEMFDALIAAKAIPTQDLSDAERVKLGSSGQLLMTVGAVWLAQTRLKKTWRVPDGQLAAAMMPIFEGETQAWTGAQGGGVFAVSRHSANIKGAAAIVQWATTDPTIQESAVTMPAYEPVQDAWAKKNLSADPLWAKDPTEVFKAQAKLIRPTWSATRYDSVETFKNVAVAGVKNGKTLGSLIAKLQSDSVALAKSANYDVTTNSR